MTTSPSPSFTNDDITSSYEGTVTSSNYRRLGYDRLTHGVYGHWPPVDPGNEAESRRPRLLTHVRAVLAAHLSTRAVLYGPTAFHVLDVALPERLQDWTHCHLLVTSGVNRPHRQGVIAHRRAYDLSTLRTVDRFPLLHLVDHLLQLLGATDDELVEVSDGLMRRQHPLLTQSDFTQRLLQLEGATGIKALRRIQRWVKPGTDSLYETRTRMILIRSGLPCPEVNFAVWCPSAGRTYHVDMAYPSAKVAVEYDGAVHVGDRRHMEIDAFRRRDLQEAGWIVITVTSAQLRRPDTLVRSVETALILRHASRLP